VGSTEGTYGVTWRNNWVHDNTGNGIWSDGNVHNTLYEGNIVERNSDSGIDHEISWDATIRNNVVRNNAQSYLGKSCWYGAQILVNNSQGVQIYDNKVSSKAGANGICLVDATRNNVAPTPTFLADINVHHNIVRVSKSAMTGLVGNAANGVTFDWNTYYVPDLSGKYWAWYDRSPLDWTDFRMRGAEANGTRALSK
jgi:parallel beta-helix repeat protein